MAIKLPQEYADLNKAISLPLLHEALKLYGVREFDGPENNPIILGWAKELNHSIAQWYRSDSEAWCALYMSYVCMKAGYQPPDGFDAIRARAFAKWGDPIAGEPVLGDILVFHRAGGGHVGIYVGEDKTTFHVLGGNQHSSSNGDCVSIVRIPRDRLIATRRPPMNSCSKYQVRIIRNANGFISTNEK